MWQSEALLDFGTPHIQALLLFGEIFRHDSQWGVKVFCEIEHNYLCAKKRSVSFADELLRATFVFCVLFLWHGHTNLYPAVSPPPCYRAMMSSVFTRDRFGNFPCAPLSTTLLQNE